MDKKISNSIALIITAVWAFSFIADIAIGDDYAPSPFVHMIMMGLAGAVFGQGFIKTVSNSNNGSSTPAKQTPPPARELTPEELAEVARDWLRKSLEEDGEK